MPVKRLAISSGFLLVIGLLAIGPTMAADGITPDARQGRAIAEAWCAGCHAVSSEGGGADAAPTFRAIANAPDFSAAGVRNFVARPHPPMPRLDLTKGQIEDLTAYIRTLRQR